MRKHFSKAVVYLIFVLDMIWNQHGRRYTMQMSPRLMSWDTALGAGIIFKTGVPGSVSTSDAIENLIESSTDVEEHRNVLHRSAQGRWEIQNNAANFSAPVQSLSHWCWCSMVPLQVIYQQLVGQQRPGRHGSKSVTRGKGKISKFLYSLTLILGRYSVYIGLTLDANVRKGLLPGVEVMSS